MSKRFYYPQQQGERKKAKLDISISDHNFPLSQTNEFQKESKDNDNWGDDNDDEILLLASQACEEAYTNNDISQLPDYSLCMQPPSTSTQLNPQPSTSKTEFTFKKPSFNPPSAVSTHLKEKCNRISSPLPGISSKVISKTNSHVSSTNDYDGIFNDKVFKGQDSDYIYKQLLQLQEENNKLKSENGKLLEKCVTKEGEVSILRTQLKSCQSAVDNARLERIKAQEKVQMEWNDKLSAANNQMHDLRTQLDFKNLEIISIKEKCKKLESTKVKLTQVTVGPNDISQSHRYNNNSIQSESLISQSKRVKTASNAVQTDDKAHFLKLYKTCQLESSNLSTILPFILEPCITQHHSILDYNEKLQKTTDLSQNKCRIYSTFHRLPSTPMPKEIRSRVMMSALYEDVTAVASGDCDRAEERYFNIFNSMKSILQETQNKLETVCQRVTTSFQKEMDEKYIEVTSTYLQVSREDLLKGSALYKEEQDIVSRRMIATLSYIVESSRGLQWFLKHDSSSTTQFIDTITRICVLLDMASCATLYSGLLLSISTVTSTLKSSTSQSKLLSLIKAILASRPMPFVVTYVLGIVTDVSANDGFMKVFCPGNGAGNLKTDYDQGVLLYKKDSCYIQVLLKQIEACLKCIEKQRLVDKAVETAQNLIILFNNVGDNGALVRENSRCDCQLVLVQVIVYALRICAVMLDRLNNNTIDNLPHSKHSDLLSVCRCGIQLLCQCAARDVELSSQLSHNEGHLIQFCELMKNYTHTEAYSNMLTELAGTLQSSPEDMPPSFHRQPWLKSFESFSLVD
ncbi:mutagen-sensitive 304 [Anticarsia gemmatalis]|uniref:mutagen-sensitive 304 n=1 Tax=Anticarsia gemmatalis TaxID=129554 RepID=UPI003F76FE6F